MNATPSLHSTPNDCFFESDLAPYIPLSSCRNAVIDDLDRRVEVVIQGAGYQLDRLLDPAVGNVTLATMSKAARAVGRELHIALIQPQQEYTTCSVSEKRPILLKNPSSDILVEHH